MKSKILVSTIALATMLGAGLVLPNVASAHEVVHEKHVRVIRDADHHNHHYGDRDRWYVERHHEVRSRWAPPGHQHKHHKKHGKKHDHEPVRYERRVYREVQPVERHREYRRHSSDGLRIHIGYALVM